MNLSTWPLLVLNLAATSVWVAVLVLVVLRHRSGIRAVTKDYVTLLVSVFAAGVFIPGGPCWWLVDHWRTRHHPVPGRPKSHERTYATD